MVSMAHGSYRKLTGTEACCELAELLTQELGMSISPAAVRTLFERRWSRLSILAHAIHDNDPPPATTSINAAKQGAGLINQAGPYRREPR